jgi:AbrB family looped-hinge helix DNA binding protein
MTAGPISKVNGRGAVVLPAELRRLFGIVQGSAVIAEARADGILIRPAPVVPPEVYTPERKAELLLGSAVNAEDYARVVAEVRAMGLDPETIRHHKPPGKKAPPLFKLGDRVRIRRSGYRPGRIVELWGPLGPGGVHIYRVRYRRKPPAYIDVREDQLVLVPPQA